MKLYLLLDKSIKSVDGYRSDVWHGAIIAIRITAKTLMNSYDFLEKSSMVQRQHKPHRLYTSYTIIYIIYAFIDALKRLSIKYPEETKEYNIL